MGYILTEALKSQSAGAGRRHFYRRAIAITTAQHAATPGDSAVYEASLAFYSGAATPHATVLLLFVCPPALADLLWKL